MFKILKTISRTLPYLLIAFTVGFGLVPFLVNATTPPLPPQQGGTGISTTSPANVGKFMQVASTTPLSYTFGATASTITFNGFTGSTFDVLTQAGDLLRTINNGSTTISLATTTVSPGTYTLATVTVDSKGRITSITAGTGIQTQASSTINGLIGPFQILPGTNISIATTTSPTTFTINNTAPASIGGTGATSSVAYFTNPSTLGFVASNPSTAVQCLLQSGNGTTASAPVFGPCPSAAAATFYMWNSSSTSVQADKQLVATATTTLNTFTTNAVASGTILATYITQVGFPGVSSVPSGDWVFHVHASETGGTAALRGDFYEETSTGTDIGLIGSTDFTPNLTTSNAEYIQTFVDANPYNFASTTSRIALKVFTRTASTPNINIFTGGNSDSHIETPNNPASTQFFVPYNGATNDINIGAHTISLSSTSLVSPLDGVLTINNVQHQNIPTLHADSGFTFYGCDVLNQDLCIVGQNNSGTSLTLGQVVYTNGQSSTAQIPSVVLAQANSTTTLPVLGVIATSSVANQGYTQVMEKGVLEGVDTHIYTSGQPVYLSPTVAGGLTTSRPVPPYFVNRVGTIGDIGVSTGTIIVNVAPFVGGVESGTNSPTFTINGANALTSSTLSSFLSAGTGTNLTTSVGVTTINNSGVLSVDNATGTVTTEKMIQWSEIDSTSSATALGNTFPLPTFYTTSTIDKVYVSSRDAGGTIGWNLFYATDPTSATSSAFKVFSSTQTTTSTPANAKALTSFASSTPGLGQTLLLYTENASTTGVTWSIYYH